MFKITSWLSKKKKIDSGAQIFNYDIQLELELLKTSFDYSIGNNLEKEIITKIVENIVKEIYPEVREKLMGHKGFEKIINEIRLNIAKQYVK